MSQTARNKWDLIIPFEPLWNEYERITKDNAEIILFGNGMFTADLMQSNRKLWRYNLIWHKTQPTGFLNAKKMPLRAHEDICVFYKKLPIYHPQMTTGHVRKVSKASHHVNAKETLNYGEYNVVDYDSTERYPTSVTTFSKDTQKEKYHSTQKPVALIEYLIKTYTNPGDLVLDSCAGSMTLAVAAMNTGRNYICIEKDPEIFEIGKKRVEDYMRDFQNAYPNDYYTEFDRKYACWANNHNGWRKAKKKWRKIGKKRIRREVKEEIDREVEELYE